MANVTIATPLGFLELGPGAGIVVDGVNGVAVVNELTVYGMYYPPGVAPPAGPDPLFLPVPVDDSGGAG